MNVRDSFIHAKNAIFFLGQEQTPQLDDNSNGVSNEKSDGILARHYTLGVEIMLAGDDPLIGEVSPEQSLSGNTSASIFAKNVTTTGTIDKVWAVITHPDYDYIPGIPIIDMPTINLVYNSSSERYEGTYTDFSTCGRFHIAIYAMDTQSNLSIPSETNVVQTIGLPPKGDVDGSCSIDLADIITSLQLLAGFEPANIKPESDINGNGKIGLEEAVYILQKVSEMR